MEFQTPDSDALFQTPDHDAVNGPAQSMMESAGRGALRNFPLAQQAAAAAAPYNPLSEHPTYGAELQHLTHAAEQGKAQNPKAYGAGAVAGTLAPLAIPLVGEGLEAAPILANAGLGAAQNISDTNLVEQPGKAAAEIGVGGVIGGGFGAAGKYLAGANKAAVPAAEAATPIAESEQAMAARAFGKPNPDLTNIGGRAIPNKPVAPDYVPSAERTSASMISQGLGGTPRQQLKLYIGKDPVQALNEIGDWMSTADNGKSVVGLMDRPGELLGKVQQIHDNSGKAIGSIIDKVAPTSQANAVEITKKLQALANESYDEKAEYAIGKLIKRLGDSMEEDGSIDFKALQKIKGSFGKAAKTAGHDTAGAAVRQAYGELAQYMNETVEQFGTLVKDPGLLAAYNKAKLDYKNASNLLPILRYQESKELIGGPGGHFSLRGLLGTLVGTVIPSPTHVVRNALLKSAPGVKSAMQTAAPIAGPISNRLPQAAQMELTNALESRFGKKKP